MTEHTRTPWEVLDTDFGPKIYTVQGDGAAVCQFFPFHEKGRNPTDAFLNAEANAALIVLAVNAHAQLVEALESLIEVSHSTSEEQTDAIASARSVLASLKKAGTPVPQLADQNAETL